MLNKYIGGVHKELNRKYLLIVFFGAFILSYISIILSIRLTGYGFFKNVLMAGVSRYSDFFNSCRDASVSTVYMEGHHSIYPPLANLFYKVIDLLINKDFLASSGQNAFNAYLDATAMLTFMIYLIITTLLLSLLIYQNKRGSVPEKLFFTLCIMMSHPFLYGYERGNIIVVALILTAFFAFCYDNDNKIVRELTFICLAIAVAIKIYPIFAGLLLLRKKKYKESIRTIIYCIVLFFGPFYFYGGYNGFLSFLKNAFSFISGQSGAVLMSNNSLKVLVSYFGSITGMTWFKNNNIILILAVALAVFAIFVSKTEWKRQGLVFSLIYNFPGAVGHYIWIFSLIPLMFMMNQKTYKKTDLIYLLLFTSELIYYPVFYHTNYAINGYILCVVTNTIFVMLMVEAIYGFIREILKKRKPKKIVTV